MNRPSLAMTTETVHDGISPSSQMPAAAGNSFVSAMDDGRSSLPPSPPGSYNSRPLRHSPKRSNSSHCPSPSKENGTHTPKRANNDLLNASQHTPRSGRQHIAPPARANSFGSPRSKQAINTSTLFTTPISISKRNKLKEWAKQDSDKKRQEKQKPLGAMRTDDLDTTQQQQPLAPPLNKSPRPSSKSPVVGRKQYQSAPFDSSIPTKPRRGRNPYQTTPQKCHSTPIETTMTPSPPKRIEKPPTRSNSTPLPMNTIMMPLAGSPDENGTTSPTTADTHTMVTSSNVNSGARRRGRKSQMFSPEKPAQRSVSLGMACKGGDIHPQPQQQHQESVPAPPRPMMSRACSSNDIMGRKSRKKSTIFAPEMLSPLTRNDMDEQQQQQQNQQRVPAPPRPMMSRACSSNDIMGRKSRKKSTIFAPEMLSPLTRNDIDEQQQHNQESAPTPPRPMMSRACSSNDMMIRRSRKKSIYTAQQQEQKQNSSNETFVVPMQPEGSTLPPTPSNNSKALPNRRDLLKKQGSGRNLRALFVKSASISHINLSAQTTTTSTTMSGSSHEQLVGSHNRQPGGKKGSSLFSPMKLKLKSSSAKEDDEQPIKRSTICESRTPTTTTTVEGEAIKKIMIQSDHGGTDNSYEMHLSMIRDKYASNRNTLMHSQSDHGDEQHLKKQQEGKTPVQVDDSKSMVQSDHGSTKTPYEMHLSMIKDKYASSGNTSLSQSDHGGRRSKKNQFGKTPVLDDSNMTESTAETTPPQSCRRLVRSGSRDKKLASAVTDSDSKNNNKKKKKSKRFHYLLKNKKTKPSRANSNEGLEIMSSPKRQEEQELNHSSSFTGINRSASLDGLRTINSPRRQPKGNKNDTFCDDDNDDEDDDDDDDIDDNDYEDDDDDDSDDGSLNLQHVIVGGFGMKKEQQQHKMAMSMPVLNKSDDDDGSNDDEGSLSSCEEFASEEQKSGIISGLWNSISHFKSIPGDHDSDSDEEEGQAIGGQNTSSPISKKAGGLITGFLDNLYDSVMNEDGNNREIDEEDGMIENRLNKIVENYY